MAFSFQYVRILKLREDEEQERKSDLAKAQYHRDRAQAAYQNLVEEKEEFDLQRANRLLEGFKASELVWYRQSEQWFIDSIAAAKTAVRQAELEVINARVALVKATQERKKFEKLKEIALERFNTAEMAKEASLIDSIVTYNSSTKGGSDR